MAIPNINLFDDLEDLVEEAIERFGKTAGAVEKKVYADMLVALGKLETRGGRILPTRDNFKKLQSIFNTLNDSVLSAKYTDGVDRFIKDLTATSAVLGEYFTSLDSGFSVKGVQFTEMRNAVIDNVKFNMLQDGVASRVIKPIEQIIRQNVTLGGSLDDLRKSLEVAIIGQEGELGTLNKYTKQITTDAINQYNREYIQAASDDLGLEWYFYAVSKIETSRQFCKARAGKYWHKSEILAWADLDWQGKRAGTTESNIFTYLGGYNCRHKLVPVISGIVPKKDLERIENE